MVSSIIFYCVASSVLVWIQQAKKSTKPLVSKLNYKKINRATTTLATTTTAAAAAAAAAAATTTTTSHAVACGAST